MNSPISNFPNANASHVRAIIAAAAATSAIGVAVAVSGWFGGHSSSNVHAPAVVSAPAPVQASRVEIARPAAPTFFIAGSAAQAAALERALGDSESARANVNEAPLGDRVFLFGSAAEADAFASMIAASNADLADAGRPELTVVDLRGS